MISTHGLFHGIYSANLAGNSPYLFVDCIVRWNTSHFVASFRAIFLIPGQYKFWRIISSVISNPG